jgi:predicted transcriptional regulator
MDCDSRCNCKCQLLGHLEDRIMDILWNSADPLKPAEVRSQLTGDQAYTTIMTIMKRLCDKSLLKRQIKGKVFYYYPAVSRHDHAVQALDGLLSRLLKTYGPLVSARLAHLTKS